MRCIFCKQDSSISRTIEHIIPESLGNKDANVSLKEVELYLLPLVLEGIFFGYHFPELTEKMNRKFYDTVNIDWKTWLPNDVKIRMKVGGNSPLAPPKCGFR